MPIAMVWELFVGGGGDVRFWEALDAGSPFWGWPVWGALRECGLLLPSGGWSFWVWWWVVSHGGDSPKTKSLAQSFKIISHRKFLIILLKNVPAFFKSISHFRGRVHSSSYLMFR